MSLESLQELSYKPCDPACLAHFLLFHTYTFSCNISSFSCTSWGTSHFSHFLSILPRISVTLDNLCFVYSFSFKVWFCFISLIVWNLHLLYSFFAKFPFLVLSFPIFLILYLLIDFLYYFFLLIKPIGKVL